MLSDAPLSRRRFGLGLGAMAALTALPAAALTVGQAKDLIDKAVADINRIISSGKSEAQMFPDFEKLFPPDIFNNRR